MSLFTWNLLVGKELDISCSTDYIFACAVRDPEYSSLKF